MSRVEMSEIEMSWIQIFSRLFRSHARCRSRPALQRIGRWQARAKRSHRSIRLRTTPLRGMLRSPTQRPTAFEVRLKTQWESADATEPPRDVRYLQVGLSSRHPASVRVAASAAEKPRTPAASEHPPQQCREMTDPTLAARSPARANHWRAAPTAADRCAPRDAVGSDAALRRDAAKSAGMARSPSGASVPRLRQRPMRRERRSSRPDSTRARPRPARVC